ncbi:hypothetical protein [Clostridium puniceum]|nr:hypothetical protein [Clostridium puniceum]
MMSILKDAAKSIMYLFRLDLEGGCKIKGINYPSTIVEHVISILIKE